MFVKNISTNNNYILNIYEDDKGEIYFSIPNVCEAAQGNTEKEIEKIKDKGFGEFIIFIENVAYLPFQYSLGWISNIENNNIARVVEVNTNVHYYWGERIKRIKELLAEV